MGKRVIVLLVIVLFGFNTGCMTIANGGKQTVSFDSTPEGANIMTMGGVSLGAAPVEAVLKRKKDHYITFKKEGYDDKTILVANELSPWFWLFGGIIDLITGAAYRFENDHYHAELKPVKAE